MVKRRVILELKYSKDLAEAAFAAMPAAEKALDTGAVPEIAGVTYDVGFAPTYLPGLRPRTALEASYETGVKFDLAEEPTESTYIVRAEVDETKLDDVARDKSVVGRFSDVQIEPMPICPGDPPMGTDADVERLLCVAKLHQIGMDGKGVLVAIVDSGVNLAYLNAQGKTPTFDPLRSWAWSPGATPGTMPVGHGTMCAFDVCIAAPKCTLLDIVLLRPISPTPAGFSGMLSDAVRAYNHLLQVMRAPRRPGETRSLVVNNSWGMFHPTWDFPVGDPGNYSDNPNHPFNRIVAALERAGADILFAAGNCGTDCPDLRCQGVTNNVIYGANGHAAVLCVAGVDISKTRVGYSSKGPGRLSVNKPDISGYTHFQGSGVYSADGGTSAATPVVAGVVAGVRNKRPFNPGNPAVSPSAIRALLRGTAQDLGLAGYDFEHGAGVVNGCGLYRRFRPPVVGDICRRFPWICRPRPVPIDLCRRFPDLCRPRVPVPPGPLPPQAEAAGYIMADLNPDVLAQMDPEDLLVLLLELGEPGAHVPSAQNASRSGSCSCGNAAS